jgi:hypothetical protein
MKVPVLPNSVLKKAKKVRPYVKTPKEKLHDKVVSTFFTFML